MEKYLPALEICPLFRGVHKNGILSLLRCLGALRKHYDKGSFLFTPAQPVSCVGIVLSGSVHIVQEDYWGNRTILACMEPGDMFGEAFSFAETDIVVSVVAAQSTLVLLIDCRKIAAVCSSACSFHNRMLANLLHVLASKNVMLTRKIEILTRRSLREKLLAYLSSQARQSGSATFSLPFNRQELAEYLAVDRSALSAELSRMRRDGLLLYHRNHFELL